MNILKALKWAVFSAALAATAASGFSCGKSDDAGKPAPPEVVQPKPPEKAPVTPEKPEPAKDPVPPADVKPSYPTIEEILKMPDENINLSLALLLVAAAEGDDAKLDVEKNMAVLDKMAEELTGVLKVSIGPSDTVARMADYIYAKQGFRADRNLENLNTTFLPNILKLRSANCMGLVQLWVSLGQKLGLPIYAVKYPNHIFLRYDDGKGTRFNIETLDVVMPGEHEHEYAQSFPDEDFLKKLSPEAASSGAYMRNLTRKELIAALYSNVGAGQTATARMAKTGDDYRAMLARAERSLSLSIELDPRCYDAYSNRLALRALYMGKYEDALLDYASAMKLNPETRLALLGGRAHAYRGDYDSSKSLYKTVIESEKVSPSLKEFAYLSLADAALVTGKFDEGIAVCEERLKVDSKMAGYYDVMARLLIAKGKTDKGLEAGFYAVKYAEKSPNGYIARAQGYYGKGKMTEAKEDLEKASKLGFYWDNPRLAECHYLLGEIYRAEGDIKKAKLAYAKALEYDPTHPGAKAAAESIK